MYYYNFYPMSEANLGSLVDDLPVIETVATSKKNGDLGVGDETPRPIVEIHICPICLHPCEGSKELMDHYWGYCQKTRNYFDTMMSVVAE
jgi:hypothetical protein